MHVQRPLTIAYIMKKWYQTWPNDNQNCQGHPYHDLCKTDLIFSGRTMPVQTNVTGAAAGAPANAMGPII